MKKKKKLFLAFILSVLFLFSHFYLYSQLSLTAQLRTRTEFRNGYGTLEPKTNDASFFTSQRSRLTFNYKISRIIFQASLQDVRIWGQDASTISSADGSRFSVHEAWAEVALANSKDTSFKKKTVDYFAVKIGRQEILYDDSRLLGNLDWLQQGRRHDAIVFKLKNRGWQVDMGAAFNQNSDAVNYSGTYYTPANSTPYVKDSKGNLMAVPSGWIPLTNSTGWSTKTGSPSFQIPPSTNSLNQEYKSLQYLYIAKAFHSANLSALLLADEFGKYTFDSLKNVSGNDTGYLYGQHFNQKGVNARVTTGFLLNTPLNQKKSLSISAGFYFQSGKDKDGLSLSAYTSALSMTYTGRNLKYTIGWDNLSGNNSFSSSTINHRFDPLYGTPHKFWGYLDYFYAGSGSPSGGLNDPYAKIKYESKGKKFSLGIDYHYFMLAAVQNDIYNNVIDKYLGSEVDLTSTYILNPFTSIEFGFCIMAATKSMEYAKKIAPGSSNLQAQWSFLMINIKPEYLFK